MFRNIVLFPHRAGQRRPGVDKTPYFVKSLLHPHSKVIESPVNHDLKSNLYNLYQKNVLIDGPRVNVGGDHSMSIATVADSIRRYPKLKVIWMDAHADINTYNESTSKNFHGMPLSILTGIEKNTSLTFIKQHIDTKDILYVGIRDIDPFEKYIIDHYKMNIVTIDELHDNYNNNGWNKISSFIGNNPVHFSFDVDVLDPSVLPSTGTSVENGIQLEACKNIVDKMMSKNLVSVDLTELNLTIGHVEERAKSIINFCYLFKNYIF
jgi:arginase|tara:strand:+ start:14 stop:808 length:795 start_codon:yes stop_codon:yes gene_type:complete